ncbi:PREDICTED: probable serine/threonine-protein kinase dyrk2 isoform X3 [Rhagoletis zephyria]|uniref:probable serine/threonine-protein kinase dyrk2 isoform X3 n=1 Tax=Rhagoletis zephyria TaxID=28612 RepID=UPI00081187E6|nr:PREDICTED: probable serine/threonine-protein kinase dyrk2 isoform X3 [Rhagoletis zephyria]
MHVLASGIDVVKMTDSEPVSLEFIEDPYLPKLDNIVTPSLDEPTESDETFSELADWTNETEQYLRNLTLDQIFYDIDSDYTNTLELQAVETEFVATKLAKQLPSSSIAKRLRLRFFTKRTMREVKVTFIDFSKPYLAKISSSENYKKFLNIGSPSATTTTSNTTATTTTTKTNSAKDNTSKLSEPASPVASVASADIAAEFAALTVEEQERQRAEWSQELARVEEEINTLRTVLASKTRHSSELKRKLGITMWKEITDDMNQGLKNVKESSVFQRTESVLKSTSEKTASVFGSITSGITSKFSQMKNSESMRSIEEKVGSAYENVKVSYDHNHFLCQPHATRVSTSRSGSINSFPDALNENNSSSGLNSPTDSVPK